MKVAPHVFLIALALAGCGFGAQIDSGRDTGGRFLELMSMGKFQQAHELCAGTEVSIAELEAWAADPGNKSMLVDFAGVDWSAGGELKTENGMSTMRLPPSPLKDRPDVTVNFAFRKDDGVWKITGFAIKSGK